MNTYQEAEKKLAELSGWKDVSVETYRDGSYRFFGRFNGSSGFDQVPKWTQDWNECGALMIEHQLKVDCDDIGEAHCVEVTVRALKDRTTFVEYYADHSSKDDAVCFAVVRAVTAKLEYELEQSAAKEKRITWTRTNSPSIG